MRKYFSGFTTRMVFILGVILLLIIAFGIFYKNQTENKTSLDNSGNKLAPAVNEPIIGASFKTLDGKNKNLTEFRGKKVMLWLLATWCPSCIAGARVLAENNDKLGNLTVIALKSYGNAGYPGPSIGEFAKLYAQKMLSSENWLWGDASRATTSTYNPRNYPDIYFLIDEEGILKDISGAPSATINKIIDFANE